MRTDFTCDVYIPHLDRELPGIFTIDADEYPAEPTSWGEGRGTEVNVSAKFIGVELGDIVLRENMVAAAFGQALIEEAEETAADLYYQQNYEI